MKASFDQDGFFFKNDGLTFAIIINNTAQHSHICPSDPQMKL